MNNAFVDFCIYFNKLTKQFAKNKIQDRQLIDVILDKDDLSNKNVFQKHIYAANGTFQRLFTHLFPQNIKSYTHILNTLLYDVYVFIYIAEDFENNGVLFQWGSRNEQSGREIFDASRFIFHLQALKTETAYLREVIPVSIFLLRQSLEVLGKNCLGFHSITSKSKQRFKNTQVSWEFITNDQNSIAPKIKLPLDIHIINKIIVWTNSYIHTGNLKDYYIIENIQDILLKLYFAPFNSRVKNYKNNLITFGVIQVANYSELKKEFEAYINKRQTPLWERFLIKIKCRKIKEAQWIVNWYPTDSIWESTIVSI